MGYHVEIIRKDGKGKKSAISEAELHELVQNEPAKYQFSSSMKVSKAGLIVRWKSQAVELALQRGVLWTPNPDELAIEAMLELAGKLGARVRGDENEYYRTPKDTYFDPADEAEKGEALRYAQEHIKKNKRGQRIIILFIWGFFALIGGIALLIVKLVQN